MRSRERGRVTKQAKAISGAPSSFAAAKIARRLSPMSFRSPQSGRWPYSISTGRPPPSSSSDPAAGLGARIQHFAARFGLTLAETRVLGEITGGNGLLAAATRLKITEATARTHAKHVLAKTGTNRQTELIRRFFATSLPGSP
jgi:DNA-binding CsgD family transcriptional regulator